MAKFRGSKTESYKRALLNEQLFPPGLYDLDRIYEIFEVNNLIPEEHNVSRSDVNYPLWKNYIHSIRPKIVRITYLGSKKYMFS